jgi:hypothetical protein
LLPLFLTLFALSVGGLTKILHAPPPFQIDIGGEGDERFLTSFFAPETQGDGTENDISFRWTSDLSRLYLHGAPRSSFVLSLRIFGEAARLDENPTLALTLARDEGGRHESPPPLASIPIERNWRVYHVLLPPHAVGQTIETEPIALVCSHPFTHPDDGRVLGVPIDWAAIHPVPIDNPYTGYPLRWAFALTCALALAVGAMGYIFSHPSFPLSPRRALAVLVGIALAGVGGVAMWATHNPYTLAETFPLTWHVLSLAGVFLVIGVGQRLGAINLLSQALSRARTRILSLSSLRLWRIGGYWPLAIAIATLLIAHTLLLPFTPVNLQGAAVLFILGMPGGIIAVRVFRDERDPIAKLFLLLCGAVGGIPLLLLPLHMLPGGVAWWMPLLISDGVAIATLATFRGHQHETAPQPASLRSALADHRYTLVPLIIIVAIGGALRMMALGGAEFQGDEAHVLLIATGVPHGLDDILMVHRKGPTEILLTSGPLIVTGRMTEWVARLPFAIAGIGTMLGVYLVSRLIARHLMMTSVMPLVATAIVALDGFLIAFSRIVQYQSILLLMTLGAFWLCWRFLEGAPRPRRLLTAAAVLMAIAALSHYDVVFGVAALGWIVVVGGHRRGWTAREWVAHLALPMAVGGAIVASFYVPFILSDHFQQTADYLTWRVAKNDPGTLFNHLPLYYLLATFYNTTYQMQAIGMVLAVAMVGWVWSYVRPRPLNLVLAILFVLGNITLVSIPGQVESGTGVVWVAASIAIPLIGLMLSPATPLGLRVVVIWFGVPFIAESFVIAKPGTHFYTMDPAAALLIGYAAAQTVHWLQERRWEWVNAAMAVGGMAVVALALPYLFLVYVQQVPEYRRTFPRERPHLYRAPYDDKRPLLGGYFGFPHRDGWKVIGHLYQTGVLEGSYDSNQKAPIVGWYTRGAQRCDVQPDYYFASWQEEDGRIAIPAGYEVFGTVTVEGREMITIYQHQPVDHAPRLLPLREYQAQFDAAKIEPFPLWQALGEKKPCEE